jgi:hypothetical protein
LVSRRYKRSSVLSRTDWTSRTFLSFSLIPETVLSSLSIAIVLCFRESRKIPNLLCCLLMFSKLGVRRDMICDPKPWLRVWEKEL